MVIKNRTAFSVFLSTLSLRRATGAPVDRMPSSSISIHALLAESDLKTPPQGSRSQIFLSTLSLRRATAQVLKNSLGPVDFYPRSPCGERPSRLHKILADWDFYPRSPCGERHLALPADLQIRDFYPRSPCGERPHIHSTSGDRRGISIHALLAESDNGPDY